MSAACFDSAQRSWDDEAAAAALDVRNHGDDFALGSMHAFPLSIVELARSCGDVLEDLRPFTQGEDVPAGSRDVETMSEDELVSALAEALGFVLVLTCWMTRACLQC
ncbi:hypothetical protein [Nocardioides zhouii]|uniref:Uncharacterized protein n=1 Tax=Nocardioides zhouii TaxID=1168729 RepID=A0A4Q2SNN5_9ACTN|nr:hypothetical protein [Nocardioides zhouii]RYC05678.1 hypothetical protein EUA94_18185 [Nocardioides zhouii]